MNDTEIIELGKFARLNIPICQNHLEYLREVVDVYESVDNIAEKMESDISLKEQISILHFNFLLTNSDLEINIIAKNLVIAEFKWEKIYFIKLANLNIYETANTYNKHKKEIKDIADKFPEQKEKFTKINSAIKDFNNTYSLQTKINNVRNKTIGHVEKNMKDYFTALSDIDYRKSLTMIYEFMIILHVLQEFSLECLMLNGPEIPSNFDVDKNYNDLKTKLNIDTNYIKNIR